MRKLLLAALACVAMPANATLIQIDLSGTSFSIDRSGEGSPFIYGPFVQASFLLDTFDLSSAYYQFGERNGQTCVEAFRTNFGLRHASVSYDGVEAFSTSGTANFVGDGPPPCNGWFSGLGFETTETEHSSPEQGRFGISFDLSGVYTLEKFLASSDPIFDLLSFGMIAPYLHLPHSGTDRMIIPGEYVSIYQVPEPGTLAMFILGLLGLLVSRRRKSTR